MTTTVAFIGLGVMGFPMAGFLSRAGYKVQVYNRTASRAQLWLDSYEGEAFTTPAKAAEGADYVFCCVGNDDDLRQVTTGENGAFHGMAAGTLFIDHTTASANVARELADAASRCGIGFLDAPVSGGQAGAENGALTIMVGGVDADYQRVSPLLNCYARAVNLLGPVGSGQLCKMVNQICIAGLVQGLSEGLHFARAAGLDPAQVVEVISKGAAQSWQMENRYKTMLAGEYEHGFAVDWMRKDLGIVLDEAQKNGALLPVTALVDQFYSEVQALGGGRWDTSSLFARLTNLRDFD
ncbi:NAD(P)-dependent oxidoreductase [Microbulbifer sp. ARAS458-1]|uniref:NAD(P)-dependent oxidoreductase n=1 Tax=Microbulbifer sp. ARAS458-1 TaxID=3140242 RepID=UPI003877EC95